MKITGEISGGIQKSVVEIMLALVKLKKSVVEFMLALVK